MIAGGIVLHLLRALRRAAARLLMWFLVTGLITAVVVELVAILSTQRLPSAVTDLTAVALGIAVGYGVTVTLLVGEVIRDLFVAVEDVERDVTKELAAGGRLAEQLLHTLEQPQRRV